MWVPKCVVSGKNMTSPMQPQTSRWNQKSLYSDLQEKWKLSHRAIQSQHRPKSFQLPTICPTNQKVPETMLNSFQPPFFWSSMGLSSSKRLSRRQQRHASRPTPGGGRGNRLPGGGAAGATWDGDRRPWVSPGTMGKTWETHGKNMRTCKKQGILDNIWRNCFGFCKHFTVITAGL